MPIRSASGAKMVKVSSAMRLRLSAREIWSIVRILWVRSANFTKRTRMSSLIAKTNLRKFSACLLSDFISIRVNLVTPSTRLAISSVNCCWICSSVTSVSSTTSCKSAVIIVAGSRCISARICATSMGWVKYGSPEARTCPRWAFSAKLNARDNKSSSIAGLYARMRSVSGFTSITVMSSNLHQKWQSGSQNKK